MSIDARVDRVELYPDGSGKLYLKDRPAIRSGSTPGIAGQAVLFFDKAPEDVGSLEGKDIWGSDNIIMLGEQRIARRDGYTGIVFEVDRLVVDLSESTWEKIHGFQKSFRGYM
jgi:hypothetical protein